MLRNKKCYKSKSKIRIMGDQQEVENCSLEIEHSSLENEENNSEMKISEKKNEEIVKESQSRKAENILDNQMLGIILDKLSEMKRESTEVLISLENRLGDTVNHLSEMKSEIKRDYAENLVSMENRLKETVEHLTNSLEDRIKESTGKLES